MLYSDAAISNQIKLKGRVNRRTAAGRGDISPQYTSGGRRELTHQKHVCVDVDVQGLHKARPFPQQTSGR